MQPFHCRIYSCLSSILFFIRFAFLFEFILQNALEPMQVDIHPEDNDNFEEDLPHIVENSNLVTFLTTGISISLYDINKEMVN